MPNITVIHISVPSAMASEMDGFVEAGYARTRADFARLAIYREMDRIKALDVKTNTTE